MSSVPRNVLLALFASSVLSGCASTLDPPLVFVQTTSVGITAATTGGQATPELTVGYRDVDVALVPVTKGDRVIGSAAPGHTGQFADSFSVLGQFDVGVAAKTGLVPGVSLGKFFATGAAASTLAEGYRCQLGAPGNTDPTKCIVPQ
jgi:hypothetical protein